MTNRERLIAMAAGRPIDRPPYFCFFGPWGETLERWHAEGLPTDKRWDDGLGFDAGITVVPVKLGYLPAFEYEELADEGETLVFRDAQGITQRVRKGKSTIPQYLDYPVKNRADWEQLKKRLDPDDPARFPDDWPNIAAALNGGDAAVQIGHYPYGLFGTLRNMIGVEDLLTGFYDFPGLIEDMMNYLTDFWIAIWTKAVRHVKLDAIHMWEDMSGRSGPLISPAMVRKYMVPCYRRMRDFCDVHGVSLFTLDTDGDVSRLIEPFMDAGINLLFPFEVQAGSDINAVVKRHPSLICLGGIDKRALAISREAIDAELARIRPALASGHYIPQLDHLIHPEIPYENFVYFCMRLREIIEADFSVVLSREA